MLLVVDAAECFSVRLKCLYTKDSSVRVACNDEGVKAVK